MNSQIGTWLFRTASMLSWIYRCRSCKRFAPHLKSCRSECSVTMTEAATWSVTYFRKRQSFVLPVIRRSRRWASLPANYTSGMGLFLKVCHSVGNSHNLLAIHPLFIILMLLQQIRILIPIPDDLENDIIRPTAHVIIFP